MQNIIVVRNILSSYIGGGWGYDTFQTGTTPVRVIRGTDFDQVARGDYSSVPKRYEKLSKLNRRLAVPGDVFIEVAGGSPASGQFTGRTLLITQGIIDKLGGQVIPASFCKLMRLDQTKADPTYIYYYLQEMYSSGRVANYELQSTGISNFQFEYFLDEETINLPDLSKQKRIAEILRAYDDKIQVNNQNNITLESIAQAIFKEWFVDFNYPGATGEMVQSPLGPIPKDWRVGKLGEILTLEIGGDWGTEEPDSDRVAVVCLRGTDLDKLKAVGYADEAPVRWIKENSLQKRNITETDILIGGSGLGPIGKSIYCDRNLQTLYDLPIIYSNFCKKLRAKTPYEAMFAEILLENIYIGGEMRQFFSGTSIPNLDINSLLDNQVVIPEKRIITLFFNVIGKNKFAFLFNKENLHLSRLRDLLLPKLMNGEIEV